MASLFRRVQQLFYLLYGMTEILDFNSGSNCESVNGESNHGHASPLCDKRLVIFCQGDFIFVTKAARVVDQPNPSRPDLVESRRTHRCTDFLGRGDQVLDEWKLGSVHRQRAGGLGRVRNPCAYAFELNALNQTPFAIIILNRRGDVRVVRQVIDMPRLGIGDKVECPAIVRVKNGIRPGHAIALGCQRQRVVRSKISEDVFADLVVHGAVSMLRSFEWPSLIALVHKLNDEVWDRQWISQLR
jgi:hypothetical protein